VKSIAALFQILHLQCWSFSYALIYKSVKVLQSQWIFETIKWNCKIIQFWLSRWQFFSIIQYLGIISESCKIGMMRILPLLKVIVCVQFELTTNLNEAESCSVIDEGREVQVKDPHTSINTRIFYSATLYEVYMCCSKFSIYSTRVSVML
jgi:hypothetical protein